MFAKLVQYYIEWVIRLFIYTVNKTDISILMAFQVFRNWGTVCMPLELWIHVKIPKHKNLQNIFFIVLVCMKNLLIIWINIIWLWAFKISKLFCGLPKFNHILGHIVAQLQSHICKDLPNKLCKFCTSVPLISN